MNWQKINIKSVLKVLKEMDKQSLTIGTPSSIVYTDGFEEVKITYKVLKEKTQSTEENS